METLIMKYTLGTAFVVITLVFGIKVLIVVTTAMKIKAAAFFATHSWMSTLVDTLKGVVK